jgi:hypothetical protein
MHYRGVVGYTMLAKLWVIRGIPRFNPLIFKGYSGSIFFFQRFPSLFQLHTFASLSRAALAVIS